MDLATLPVITYVNPPADSSDYRFDADANEGCKAITAGEAYPLITAGALPPNTADFQLTETYALSTIPTGCPHPFLIAGSVVAQAFGTSDMSSPPIKQLVRFNYTIQMSDPDDSLSQGRDTGRDTKPKSVSILRL